MKNSIAVCSSGNMPESMLDERFGRCPYVQFWDRETGFKTAMPNSNTDMGHGAGTGTAQLVLNQRAGVVITNRIGPKAFAVLKKAGVEIYAKTESVKAKEAFELFKAGKLKKLETANN